MQLYLGFALSFPAERFFKKSLNLSLDAPSRCPPTDQHNEKKNKDCSHWIISLSEREGRSLSLGTPFSSVSFTSELTCSLQQKYYGASLEFFEMSNVSPQF
jgi:hypothetical protein